MKITRPEHRNSNVYAGLKGRVITDLNESIENTRDPLTKQTLKKRLQMLKNNNSRFKSYEDYCEEMVLAINRTPGRSGLIRKKGNMIWVEDVTPPDNLSVGDHTNAHAIMRFHGKYARKQ